VVRPTGGHARLEKLGYRPALDGVRGIAILLVLVYHAGLIPAGYYGVDVFFVLSGFLITTLLLEEHGGTGRISLAAFYGRRARRLLPAVGVMLAAAASVYVGLGQFDLPLLGYLAACLFYVANIVRASGHMFPPGLGHMWSLAQEEQFYLLWPPLLILALRRYSLRRIAIALAAAIAIAVAWRGYLTAVDGPTARVIMAPDTRADALLVGCLLAVARMQGFQPGRLLRPAGLAALAAVIAASLTVWGLTPMLLIGRPGIAIVTALVVAVAVEQRSLLARLLSFAPLVRLGVVSYSLYLWHLFAYNVVQDVPLKLALALLLAAGSYRYIEQPFRRRRLKPQPVPVPA